MRNRKYIIYIFTFMFLSLVFLMQKSIVFAAEINVPSDYSNIQEAIDVASSGDTINIRAGRYNENIYVTKNIILKGEGDGKTIIDGGSNDAVIKSWGSDVVIEGLDITGGKGGWSWGQGGGCDFFGGNLTIMNSRIYGNKTYSSGAGISMDSGGNLKIYNSVIVGNSALNNDGGGVYVHQSSCLIKNSVIAGNESLSSGQTGGGLLIWGTEFNDHKIMNSTIVGNYAEGGGDAVGIGAGANAQFSNSIIYHNNIGEYGFFEKYWQYVSRIFIDYSDTFENKPDAYTDLVTRTNSIEADPKFVGKSLPRGVGVNFASDWLSFDFHLQKDSPCIDAGNPNDPVPANGGSRIDMGAYEFIQNTFKNHGQYVSNVAKSTEPGPTHGQIVSDAARNKSQNNYALSFDGIDDYVIIQNSTSLQLQDQLTISAWINTREIPYDWNQILSKGATYGTLWSDYGLWVYSRNGWGYQNSNFAINFEVSTENNNPYFVSSNGNLNDGWNYVVAVYSSGNVRLYLNGQLDTTTTIPIESVRVSSQPLYIGMRYEYYLQDPFKGQIDDIRIWNKALTQDEIQSNMFREIPPQDGLVGYWQFDEGSGNIALDSSGNGNDGTLVNGPTWTTDTPF